MWEACKQHVNNVRNVKRLDVVEFYI